MPAATRGVDLRPDLALAVLDAEREVLEPGHHSRPRPAHCTVEVEQRPADDRVGLPLRDRRPRTRSGPSATDRASARCSRPRARWRARPGRSRRAAWPRCRRPTRRGRRRVERAAPRVREKADHRVRRIAPEPRNDHRSEWPVGPADVVVEDVVDAELRRGDGEVDVVGLDVGMDVVREAAVAARVRAAGGRLDDELPTAVRPRPLGQDRVAKGDEASDHPRAAIVQELHRRGEVVRVPLGTDLPGHRHAGAPADDAELVLDVELDGVDPPLGEQAQHARP